MRAGGPPAGVLVARNPRSKVKLFTRRQLHRAAADARKGAKREVAEAKKEAYRQERRGRKALAALEGCADA